MIERLFSYARRTSTSGLTMMKKIDAWLGHPHRRFASVHVGGTNGKGSVSLKIAAALEAAGLRVGLYTSPHIDSFRERIQINGATVSPAFVEQFLPDLFSFIDRNGFEPSFFDLLTALGFAAFAEAKVDCAVVEVGLGGRFDATNVITPQLSVITSIAEDHCELLGDTLDAIAFEKAGILKEGVPVVIGPRARYAPVFTAAKGREILVPEIEGFYDRENRAIARAALEALNIPEYAIEEGLLYRPPCRFEVVGSTIFDVAHNPDGFQRLAEALDEFYPQQKFQMLLAMGKKKDVLSCVRPILPKVSKISCYSNGHERLHSAEALREMLQIQPTTISNSEPLLICGSFFIMGEIQRKLGASLRLRVRYQPTEQLSPCAHSTTAASSRAPSSCPG